MNIGEYGAFGEKLAQEYLKKQGYKILTVNFAKKQGEIDIIAVETKKARKKREEFKSMTKLMQKEDVLVFVEVKSRHKVDYGRPATAVDQKKKKHYEIVANNFRLLNPKYSGLSFRFDIVEVVEERVENHYLNAF